MFGYKYLQKLFIYKLTWRLEYYTSIEINFLLMLSTYYCQAGMNYALVKI
jgi:hypothetical protein